jgi:hypothetical protein
MRGMSLAPAGGRRRGHERVGRGWDLIDGRRGGREPTGEVDRIFLVERWAGKAPDAEAVGVTVVEGWGRPGEEEKEEERDPEGH